MILKTDRLIFRPLTLADAETAYYGWTGDAEVAKYVSWLPHHSILSEYNPAWPEWYAEEKERLTCFIHLP